MIEKIKNIYGRESGIKKTFDEGTRKILTNVIVTGIPTINYVSPEKVVVG